MALSGCHPERLWVLAVLVLFLSTPLWAQGGGSSAQLFEQGMAQYQQGQYEQARQLLRQVDPMQLSSSEQRLALYRALQDLERRSQPHDWRQVLQQADAARAAGQLPQAANLYQAVLAMPGAPDVARQQAQARLAETRRQMFPDVAAARAAIDQAEADLAAGRLDAAELRLQAVKSSGLDLGWFDNERMARLLATIQQRRSSLAQAPPSSAGPVVPAPAASTPSSVVEPATVASPPGQAAVAEAAEPSTTPTVPAAPAVMPPAPLPAPVSPAPPPPAPAPAPDLLAQGRQLYAQQRLAEAQQAMQDGQYRLASELFAQALVLSPGNPEAQQGLEAAQARLAQTSAAPTSLLEQERFARTMGAEVAVAEFNQLLGQARQSMEEGNFAAAQERVAQAKVVLDRNQRFLPVSQYNSLREQAVTLGSEISQRQETARAREAATLAEQRRQETERRRKEALMQTEAEVQRLLQRAAELRRQLKYDESLQVLQQALFLDPNNVAAQAMKEMIEDSRLYVRYGQALRARSLGIAEAQVDNEEAAIPRSELVTYPSDWPELTARRLGALAAEGAQSEVNRQAMATLRQPLPVNFEARRLDNVIDYFRNTTGLNMTVNWPALAEIGIEPDAPITLQLEQVPAETALRLVLEQVSALSPQDPVTYSVVDGIVRISTQSSLTRNTEIRVYDIRDMLVQVPTFTNAPQFDLASVIEGGGTEGGGLTIEEGDEQEPISREDLVARITGLIQDTVGRQDEWVAYGGDQSSLQELNGQLIVRTTPQNHLSLQNLLGQLREARALQIHVEGRFLLVDHNFLEDVGVDVDVDNVDLGGHYAPFDIHQESDQIASRSNLGSSDIGRPWTVDSLSTPTGIPLNSLSTGFTYLSDFQVSVMIRATQADRKSVTLNAPRVTLFNGQKAYVLVAVQTAFISDLEAVDDGGGWDITLSTISAGAMLQVEGTVSADRRYVTLTLEPSLANLRQIRQLPVTAVQRDDDGNIIGTSTMFQEAPEIELTQVKATVSVPDRGTILLGGQRLMSDVRVQAGIPILSKIPIINRLTTNETNRKDERTLLVLVKPTIIIQNEMEEQLYPGMLSNPEAYTVGQQF